MKAAQSTLISMRPRAASERGLKRRAKPHEWTIRNANARLVEDGLRCSEFAFIDFRASAAGRSSATEDELPTKYLFIVGNSAFLDCRHGHQNFATSLCVQVADLRSRPNIGDCKRHFDSDV